MFSYAESVAKPSRNCSKEIFERIVADRDGRLTHLCQHINLIEQKIEKHRAEAQRLESEGKELEAKVELTSIRLLHDEKAQTKRQLPIFCFLGTYAFGKRKASCVQPNGLVFADFDHCLDADPKSQRRMEQVQRIVNALPKLVENEGLLLCHLTCSMTGVRMIFKGNPMVGYEENQRHFADVSGLSDYFDHTCKDLARPSFAVPKNYILYISDEIFTYHHPLKNTITNHEHPNDQTTSFPNEQTQNAQTVDASVPSGENQQGPVQGSLPTPAAPLPNDQTTSFPNDQWEHNEQGELTYKGVAYSRIISEWWKVMGGEPVQGERNSKLQRLATNLRYVCDNREDLLLAVMPSYGLAEAEMRQLIHSACSYQLLNYLPKALRLVLQRLDISQQPLLSQLPQDAASADGADGRRPRTVTDGEYMKRDEMEYWNQRLRSIALPIGLSHSIDSVARENAMNILMAVLPVAYTCATGVTYKLWDNQWYRLSGTTIIIGSAASGKSFCKPLLKAWLSPISAEDKAGRAVELQYKKEREAAGTTKMKNPRPQLVIRQVPAKASLSTLLERNNNAKRQVWNVPHTQQYWQHTHLITVEFEFSTIVKSLKQSFSDYMDFLVKSHQDEEIGVDYRNDASANGIRNMHWNQVFAGNFVDFHRMFNKANVLNGMPLRIMPVFIPDNSFEMNPASNNLSAFQRSNILTAAYRLDRLTGNIDAKPMSDRMFQHSARMAEWAKEHGDKVADSIRRRACSTIGMRAGVLSAVLRNAERWDELPVRVLNEQPGLLDEDKEWARVVDFCEDDFLLAELVADYVFDQQYKLFKRDMEELWLDQQLPSQGIVAKEHRDRTRNLFNSLAEEFSSSDVEDIFSCSSGGARSHISIWQKEGFIESTSRGRYKKVKPMI